MRDALALLKDDGLIDRAPRVGTHVAQRKYDHGLDMLLVNQLDANFYAVHPDLQQKSNLPLNDTVSVYGGPGLLPAGEPWS